MTENIYDILVVGAGPTGLFSTYYAGLREASVCLVDSLDAVGGRLISLYPEKPIYDVPGFRQILAHDLVARLHEQAAQFHPTIHLGRTVTKLTGEQGNFALALNDGTILNGKTVVLACGIGTYSPRRHNAPGADKFEGKGITYIANSPSKYAGRRVVVAGGGDSAVDWAAELKLAGASVTLVHRTQRFRAHPRSVTRLQELHIPIITDCEIVEFCGEKMLQSVSLREKDGREKTLEIDDVLIMFGFLSQLTTAENWGLTPGPEDGEIAVGPGFATSRPGVFAAGDIASYAGKIKLIATGFAEAATAINTAVASLRPETAIQPLHSTMIMANRSTER